MKKKKRITYNTGEKVIGSIFLIAMLLFGIYSFYNSYKESKWFNMPQTTANFISCGDEDVDGEGTVTYKAKYVYYVDNEEYEAEYNISSNECAKKPKKKLYYNPNNPSEYKLGNPIFMFILSLLGGLLLIITPIVLTVITILPKKKKD